MEKGSRCFLYAGFLQVTWQTKIQICDWDWKNINPPWACCMFKMAPQDKKQQSLRKCNFKMTFLPYQKQDVEHVQLFE